MIFAVPMDTKNVCSKITKDYLLRSNSDSLIIK